LNDQLLALSIIKIVIMKNEIEEQKKEFTGIWIPRHIIEDKDLTMSEMIIYSEISCFDICYKPNKSLGERWGLKERRISEIISKLESKGYIKRRGFDGRNRQLVALKDNPVLGRLAKKCYPDTQKNATIDNNIENKDILLADKSANEKNSENKQNISIQDLYEKIGLKQPVRKVNQWQDEASNAVNYFLDGESKRSSIFQCFKNNQQKARIAFSDCKELEKKSALYFFKIFNELKK
jgi:DNA-binding Lrp family transcriptional regulator